MKIKKGFLRALSVFFFCVFVGLIMGLLLDALELAATIGVCLGLVWMGVAYFNQEEGEEE